MRVNWTAVVAILLSALLIGTVAAFLLYVQLFTIIAVAAVVLVLIVMFGLGVQVGGRQIRPQHKDSLSSPKGS